MERRIECAATFLPANKRRKQPAKTNGDIYKTKIGRICLQFLTQNHELTGTPKKKLVASQVLRKRDVQRAMHYATRKVIMFIN
jgi:hypothetical protein